jgi:hypothetical protein
MRASCVEHEFEGSKCLVERPGDLDPLLRSEIRDIGYTRTEESSELSVFTQLRLHGRNPVQRSRVILCTKRLGILANLKREVYQGRQDGETADELTEVPKGLEVHDHPPILLEPNYWRLTALAISPVEQG